MRVSMSNARAAEKKMFFFRTIRQSCQRTKKSFVEKDVEKLAATNLYK